MSQAPASARIAITSDLGVFGTLREGIRLSPALKRGIGVTLVLAILATIGRLVVPFAVQFVTDRGLLAAGGVDLALVLRMCALAAVVLLVASAAASTANIRLFAATEAGLAELRVRAFDHIHHLSVLTQNSERRGSLVSRVTSDVDTISRFVQWGGMQLVLSSLQLVGATVAMAIYSWQLTLVVWLACLPMVVLAPRAQRALTRAFGEVRVRIGVLLGAISEAVVGAQTVRAYGVRERTRERIDVAIEEHRVARIRAQVFASLAFSTGTLLTGLALAGVVVAGTFLGMGGKLSVGELLAFLFLVQIFAGPVQTATEVLNQLQDAVAGWRRVISIIHTPRDIIETVEPRDPGPRGEARIDVEALRYAYPDGPDVLTGVTLTFPAGARVAIVGETGSGKTTLARLLTRLADPHQGAVRLNGIDLRELSFAQLRQRIVMVPQEGFLFSGTVATNIAYALGATDPERARAQVSAALADLGLTEWADSLSHGLDTPVGQRGEGLSAGERQLIAIARAYLADADVLVLDEATSAVDPATEARLNRALTWLTAGRTSIAIAHRLSTAEAADLVIVLDAGAVVEVGHHRDLVDSGGHYARMHASWRTQVTRVPDVD